MARVSIGLKVRRTLRSRTATAVAVALAALAAISGFVAACTIVPEDSSSSDPDSGVCGSATCTDTQFCLYRQCTAKEACVVSTSCPYGWTPDVCSNGSPGCINPNCADILQGCSDIPASCGSDVTCACQSVCGSAAGCLTVNGRTATCGATN
ncbi:MAG: hypothetical protein FWD73_09365 [Polyangiaceae bacterium]|nr:hypothetical protein [Polyangiaceae bacterium]